MKRLSRRGFNNMLIIVVSAMIIVLNLMERDQNDVDPTDAALQQALLPEQSLILSLDYPQARFERIGQGWRQLGGHDRQWPAEQLAELWQSMRAERLAKFAVPGVPDLVVRISLAGEAESRAYLFYEQNDSVVVMQGQQAWQLTGDQYVTLVPGSLLPRQ